MRYFEKKVKCILFGAEDKVLIDLAAVMNIETRSSTTLCET